jgi:sensor histidine kinase YesM
MKSVEFAPQSLQPVPLTARAVVDAWRSITRLEIKTAFLFGCAVFFYHVIVFSGRLLESPSLIYPLIGGFVNDQLGAFALMLAVTVADHVTSRDVRRRAMYVVAVVVGAAVAASPIWIVEARFVGSAFSWREFLNATFYAFFEWLVLGGAATVVYTDRRRAKAALARMRVAEIERAHTAKRMLESRLQAMQARVEPQFLFNTLAQVRRLYAVDALLAERMLGDLIAYLRAAMPRMRDTTSALAQEIELARAYLAIVKVRLGDRLSFSVDLPDGIGEARMPPMMLLPLIDHAVVYGLEPSEKSGSIIISSTVDGGKLKLTIADSGAGFVAEGTGRDGIASIRERLEALFGQDGQLRLEPTAASGTQAVMEIPYEIAPRSDS